MYDYSVFYRRSVQVNRIAHELQQFDVLISAFNSSERVIRVFNEVRASKRVWLVHPEYDYKPLERPLPSMCACPAGVDEVDQIDSLLAQTGNLSGKDVCIDVTGFMRHVLAFLIAKLGRLGVN